MAKKKESPSEREFRRNIGKFADEILTILRKFGTVQTEYLSQAVGISSQMVFRAIDELSNRGYHVVNPSDGEFRLATTDTRAGLPVEHHWRPTPRILVWSGSELGSRGQQGDLVKTIYSTIVPEEKPDFIIALGNVFMGALPAGRRNETFLNIEKFAEQARKKHHGSYKARVSAAELHYLAQLDYAAKIGNDIMSAPPSHPCNTYFISGLREQSFMRHGLENPLEVMCRQRRDRLSEKKLEPDWFFLGPNMHTFRVVNTGDPVTVLALTSKKTPFRGVYTRGHRPRKTSGAIAGWLINTIRTKGVGEYPRIIIWTDGVGVYAELGDSEATTFVSLPKVSVTDPTELELDTPPNIGCIILDLMFDDAGRLKPNGIEVKFRNLAPYVTERGY